jgi:hypothetical protein
MKKIFYEEGNYNQWIELEENEAKDVSCTCPDFTFRRLRKIENGNDIKYIAVDTCKHLKSIILNNNFKLNLNTLESLNNEGPNKCPKELIKTLIEEFKSCQICGKKENLQVHRIKRGNNGGKYIKSNVKLLCSKCHQQIHEFEFK